MRIAIVVAVAENGVIGRGGDLPWRIPSDLKRFRALTMGKPVVMGRKTFQSLPRALDGRVNIVVTRDRTFAAPGAETAPDLPAALELARRRALELGVDEVMVIGGGEIYAGALALADRVYLSRVAASIEGDAVFPTLDPAQWRLLSAEPLNRGPNDDHPVTLEIHERNPT